MTTNLHWKNLAGGAFNVTTNWSPAAPVGGPNATDNVYLDAAAAAFAVTSSANATVNGLDLTSNATLDITAGAFTVNAFAINAGTVNVSAGSLTLKATAFGVNNAGTGTIEATGTGAISIVGAVPVNNDGVIEANGTGALTISGGATIRGYGDVKAFAPGSSIVLNGANIISGGSVSTIGATKTTAASSIAVSGVDTLSALSITNAGAINIANGSTLTLSGALTNSGAVNLAQTVNLVAGSATIKIGAGGVNLTGGGNVVLTDNAANQIVSNGVAASLVNVSDTFAGAGTIGDAFLRVVNLQGGVIDDSGVSGLKLVGDSVAGYGALNSGLIESNGVGNLTMTGAWSNAGTIESNFGTLVLQNFVDASGGGTIATKKVGRVIDLSNATITSGVFSVLAGTTVLTSAGTTNTLPDNLVDAGTINVASSTLVLGAYLYNSGVLSISGTGQVKLGSASHVTLLKSGGAINLGSSSAGEIVSNGTVQKLVNINETLSGFGAIGGGDAHLLLQNNTDGVINATSATTALTINTGANVVANAGLIESTKAGGLTISGGLYNAGTLYAKAGLVKVGGAVTGIGNANILAGTMEFALGSSSNVDFLAGSAGMLKLDASSTLADHYTGTIFGFPTTGATDKIDFADILAAGAHIASIVATGNGDAVTFADNSGHSSTLNFAGTYTAGAFGLGADLSGHLLVT